MKKLMTLIVAGVMTLTMALPVLACETALDGASYDQKETYYLEGSSYYEDDESSDLCEVYAGNPNVAIVANEDGEEGACYTSGAYTDSGEPDDFIVDEEYDELCESIGVYPEGIIGIEGYDIENMPAIPYGGDPTPQREWAAENYCW